MCETDSERLLFFIRWRRRGYRNQRHRIANLCTARSIHHTKWTRFEERLPLSGSRKTLNLNKVVLGTSTLTIYVAHGDLQLKWFELVRLLWDNPYLALLGNTISEIMRSSQPPRLCGQIMNQRGCAGDGIVKGWVWVGDGIDSDTAGLVQPHWPHHPSKLPPRAVPWLMLSTLLVKWLVKLCPVTW